MNPTEEMIADLREKLGESLAEGQTEEDSLFTDEQVKKWLNRSKSLDEAALEGWEAKLAHFANLVNVTDGAASRALSDNFLHAQGMVSHYSRKVLGRIGRTRVGKISRR